MNSCVSCAHGPAMETTPEPSVSSHEPANLVVALPGDTATLRRQLRDLIAILALPAVWSGRDAADIREAVLEALSSMLRLDLAYIRVADRVGGGPVETARVHGRPDLGSRGCEIAGLSAQGTTEPDPNQALVLPDPATGEPLHATRTALGLAGHTGVVIAASRRSSFPTPFERFLLQSIIMQAEVALRNAALMSALHHALHSRHRPRRPDRRDAVGLRHRRRRGAREVAPACRDARGTRAVSRLRLPDRGCRRIGGLHCHEWQARV